MYSVPLFLFYQTKLLRIYLSLWFINMVSLTSHPAVYRSWLFKSNQYSRKKMEVTHPIIYNNKNKMGGINEKVQAFYKWCWRGGHEEIYGSMVAFNPDCSLKQLSSLWRCRVPIERKPARRTEREGRISADIPALTGMDIHVRM